MMIHWELLPNLSQNSHCLLTVGQFFGVFKFASIEYAISLNTDTNMRLANVVLCWCITVFFNNFQLTAINFWIVLTSNGRVNLEIYNFIKINFAILLNISKSIHVKTIIITLRICKKYRVVKKMKGECKCSNRIKKTGQKSVPRVELIDKMS